VPELLHARVVRLSIRGDQVDLLAEQAALRVQLRDGQLRSVVLLIPDKGEVAGVWPEMRCW
jgi:hypothetical protein